MTFHAVPGCAQVVMRYSQNSQITENTYWFLGTGGWTTTNLAALCTAVWSWEHLYLKATRNGSTALEVVRATDYNAPNSFFGQSTGLEPGALTGSMMPNNVSIAVKHETGLAGRANRGRSFHVGLDSTQMDAGQQEQAITGTAATAILNAYSKIVDGTIVLPNGGKLVVAHRRATVGGVVTWLSPATVQPVQGFSLSDFFIDSQRRRLPAHNRRR